MPVGTCIERVSRMAVRLTDCVPTRVVMAARIGPAQGVHKIPRTAPKRIPPESPGCGEDGDRCLPRLVIGSRRRLNRSDSLGRIITNPKSAMRMIAI